MENPSDGAADHAPADAGPARAPSLTGTTVEVDVGAVAHGGHCVARIGGQGGRVVFVRHALPGERVRVRITEDTGGAFCRGDAIEVLAASPDRVEAPCPYAGAGGCGGCDWQHASAAAQRDLKGTVVAEQFRRLAGLQVAVPVAEVPGGSLGWRSRISYAVDPVGRVGLRRHRSHRVEPLDRCLLGAQGVGDAPELAVLWPGALGLDVSVDDDGRRSVSASRVVPAAGSAGRPPLARSLARTPSAGRGSGRRRRPTVATRTEHVHGPMTLRHRVGEVEYRVGADGFWQVHPLAASTLTTAVLQAGGPWAGATVFDLYAGAGLFTAALAQAVGTTGRVVGLEGSRHAVRDAGHNVAPWPWAEVRAAQVTADTVRALGPADVTVLDPPRTGAGREVFTAILAASRRAVVYVACDPAALARDVRTALDLDWSLSHLSAFDLFPMTHHIECVAVLVPATSEVSWAPS